VVLTNVLICSSKNSRLEEHLPTTKSHHLKDTYYTMCQPQMAHCYLSTTSEWSPLMHHIFSCLTACLRVRYSKLLAGELYDSRTWTYCHSSRVQVVNRRSSPSCPIENVYWFVDGQRHPAHRLVFLGLSSLLPCFLASFLLSLFLSPL